MVLQERIKDFAFIDKRKSEIDTKRSEPEKGLFLFKPDKRNKYKIKEAGKLNDFWYHWILKNDQRINRVRVVKGYDFVTKDDHVVPEGMTTNSEGHYQFGDLVLMKCPLDSFLKRKVIARERSEQQAAASANQFISKTGGSVRKATGGNIEEDLIKEIVGELSSGKD